MSPLAQCRAWVTDFVVGLDLCPWAAAPLAREAVRWQLSRAQTFAELVAELVDEARCLLEGPHETTLVVVSEDRYPLEFLELLQLVEVGTALMRTEGLADDVQLVAFHPDFQYADCSADDPANGTNQSPHPMVHLLRRSDLDAVRVDGAVVAERNARLLRDRAAGSTS